MKKEDITLKFLQDDSKQNIIFTWIYFLLYKNNIFYIWQSKNVYSRIWYHISRWIIFDSYFVFPCNEDSLLETETYFLQKFHTEKNISRYSISDNKLAKIELTIKASDFKKLRKRILKFCWKKNIGDEYFTSLYWQVDFKTNLNKLLLQENIKITKEELLKLTHWFTSY